MRRQTYGYLISRRASPPFCRYQIIQLGDRGTWVRTTCLGLLLDSGPTGNRTHDRLIASRTPYTITPPSHPQRSYWSKIVIFFMRLFHVVRIPLAPKPFIIAAHEVGLWPTWVISCHFNHCMSHAVVKVAVCCRGLRTRQQTQRRRERL